MNKPMPKLTYKQSVEGYWDYVILTKSQLKWQIVSIVVLTILSLILGDWSLFVWYTIGILIGIFGWSFYFMRIANKRIEEYNRTGK